MRAIILSGLLVAGLTTGAAGQTLARRPAPATRASIAATLRLGDHLRHSSRSDLRWPGTIVGAVGLGIAGGLSGAGYCGNSENGPRRCTGTTIGFALGGAALGAVAGHLIGRLIPR